MARLYALSEMKEYSWVLPSQEEDPKEEQVEFTLRGLTGRERAEVVDLLARTRDVSEDGEVTDKKDLGAQTKAVRAAARFGLRGWQNLVRRKDGDSEEVVPFPGPGQDALDLLPESAVQLIGVEVLKATQLGGAEAGN